MKRLVEESTLIQTLVTIEGLFARVLSDQPKNRAMMTSDTVLFGTTTALLLWRLRNSAASASTASLDTSVYVPGNPWWILPCLKWLAGPRAAAPPLLDDTEATTADGQRAPPGLRGAGGDAGADVAFGAAARKALFLLEDGMHFLNHGSYGATLRPAFEAKLWWEGRMEAEPVRFMDDEVLPALASAQRRLATFVGAAPTDLVLVPNATTGVNAVLRSLTLAPGDVLLALDISYGACLSTLDYVAQRAGARLVRVAVPWPLNDDALVAAVATALAAEPRIVFALLDHITSTPAVLLPVARLCALCRERGVTTMVDGAHAVGALELDVPAIGCDAYTSNCHKWLMTPKGTAFLWVAPGELQRKTRPTVISHGYGLGFVREFLWAATCDYTSFLGIEAALDFFEHDGAGGPARIMAHNRALAARAGVFLAKAWGTEVLTPPAFCTTMCCVRAPTRKGARAGGGAGAVEGGGVFPPTGEGACALNHALRARGVEVPVFVFHGFLHVRISAQIYVEWRDYERLAELMVELQCV